MNEAEQGHWTELQVPILAQQAQPVQPQVDPGPYFSGAGGYQQQPQPGSFGPQTQTGGGISY